MHKKKDCRMFVSGGLCLVCCGWPVCRRGVASGGHTATGKGPTAAQGEH